MVKREKIDKSILKKKSIQQITPVNSIGEPIPNQYD
jgi:hypothetical protein